MGDPAVPAAAPVIVSSPAQVYVRPADLPEALALMTRGGYRLLAGGTDLYPGAGTRLSGPLLDLTGIAALRQIECGAGLRIGATATWSALAGAALPPACRALQQASLLVGGRQIQNAGTIAGNLCNASPAADGVPPLLALDASVELASSRGTRVISLDSFLVGPRLTALAADEILTAVLIPAPALAGRSAFVKLGARTHLVISIAMVAARITVTSGRITSAAIAVGSCSAVAQRMPLVEAALIGASPDALATLVRPEHLAALAPIDDIRATAAYRLTAARELVLRAVTEACA